jgi:hypothetical protein
MQRKMTQERKSRAFNPAYQSMRQMVLSGFETPFERIVKHAIPSQSEQL